MKSIFKKKLGESHTPLSHSTSVDSVDGNEHIYEMEPEPICDQSDLDNAMVDKGSIYENTNFPTMERRPVMKKNSSPSVLQDIQTNSNRVASTRTKSVPSILNSKMKGSYHTPDDYEDPDAIIQDMESQMDDYIVMSDQLHNTYVDPEDLRRGSSGSNVTVSSDSFTSSTKRLNSTSCKCYMFYLTDGFHKVLFQSQSVIHTVFTLNITLYENDVIVPPLTCLL